jgi:hypothetical protein
MTITELDKIITKLKVSTINADEMPVCFNEQEILDWSVEFTDTGDPFLNLHANKKKR